MKQMKTESIVKQSLVAFALAGLTFGVVACGDDSSSSAPAEEPAVATHRANLAYNPFEKTRLMFSVDNITDQKYRNFYTPFPMPGREYRFTIIQGF